MSSNIETISGNVNAAILDKADRLFRNDDASVWAEILQNARRAGASTIEIWIEETQAPADSCIVTVQDDGRGIGNFQDLLTLGKSGWNPETQVTEDPAGMGFFALCRSEVEVQSGSQFVRITPDVFLGRSVAHVQQLPESVRGTRFRFTRASTKAQMVAALHKTTEFYRLEVRLDGQPLPQHDFLEGAVYREMIDGIEVGFSPQFTRGDRNFQDDNWNFYGARLHHAALQFTGMLKPGDLTPVTIYARFNVLETARVKLQLPDRRAVIEDESFHDFQRKARAAAYRFFQTQPQHVLPFKNWQEAKQLGVHLQEAACLLSTWHASPQDEYGEPMFETCEQRLLSDASNVILVDRNLPDEHTFEGALQCGAVLAGDLYREAPEFKGYSWYERQPRIIDTAVFLDGIPYEEWTADRERPERIEVEITIAQAGESERHLRLDAFIHVDSDASVWNEACFVAVKNSPWDNDRLNGPFSVTAFVMSATFCPSDDSEADSWETQRDRYEEALQREVNGYFRGPRATLLAILQPAIDYEASRLAEEIGIAQIRFTRPAEGSHLWSVELVDRPA